MKKLKYEDVKSNIESLGYILISREYKSNLSKLTFKSNEGYYYCGSYANVLKTTPNKFDKSNPYTIQNIKLWCELNNKPFQLISNKYIGANNKLQWKCLKTDCGEIFEATWGSIHYGQGCGFCNGKQVGLSNCLATKNPELVKEWHPVKNDNLTPYDVTPNSNKKIWWICEHGHEWLVKINHRVGSGSGCPYCAGRFAIKEYNLLVYNSELASEWNYERNKNKPEDYTPHTNKKVWWKCSKNPRHEWKATINNRHNGNNCPYCAGRLPFEDYNLLVDNPELCKEWDYNKNKKKPEDYTPHSGEKVWWLCKECGYSWETSISNRNNGGNGCPECSKSRGEKKIDRILKNKNIPYVSQYIFDDLLSDLGNPLRFDFVVFNDINKTKIKTLIEFDGIQHYEWRKGMMTKEEFEKIQYHDKLKNEYCNNNNINLLRIPYWEFDDVENILQKII